MFGKLKVKKISFHCVELLLENKYSGKYLILDFSCFKMHFCRVLSYDFSISSFYNKVLGTYSSEPFFNNSRFFLFLEITFHGHELNNSNDTEKFRLSWFSIEALSVLNHCGGNSS